MAKEKPKVTKGPPNKHLSARITYLQQAALHLAGAQSSTTSRIIPASPGEYTQCIDNAPSKDTELQSTAKSAANAAHRERNGSSTYLALQLRQVALKSQIRLQCSTKHMSCKVCHAVLLEGSTCTKYTENLSRGGKKPHADMVVHECSICGMKKRFPLNVVRQLGKSKRAVRSGSTTKALPQVQEAFDVLPG